jgi:hypothetical protein
MKRSKLTLVQKIVVERIIQMCQNEAHDVEELVSLLQITEDDIYERFQDRLWDLREHFEISSDNDDGQGEEDDE